MTFAFTPETLFKCPHCRRQLPFHAFSRSKSRRASWCKPCAAESARFSYAANKDRAYANARARVVADPRKELLYAARSRASLRNIPFDLELDDIVIPACCPVFGFPLRKARGQRAPDSPSLDRIRPEKGYTKGNVRVISWRANELRRDATLHEIGALLRFLESAA